MRILLAPHGTRGDVQPLVALAIALVARGHEVRFVAPANFLDWIRAYGFECESDGIDIAAVLRSPGTDLRSLRWQMRYIRTVMAPRVFETLAAASAGVDRIVGAGLQFAAFSVAEYRAVPYVTAAICPCAVPSGGAPPPQVGRQRLPASVNRLLWRWSKPLADAWLRAPINLGRARLGLAPLRSTIAPFTENHVIVAADPDLAPLGQDAPPGVVQTEAWILDEPVALDARLNAFLEAGPPPIYVGFGSMVTNKSNDLVSAVVAATRAHACRMIVAAGWTALDPMLTSSEETLMIAEAPHAALFPRVAAVVHHGGAGTTTAAARAGVPQIILPHILDQRYWAHRIETLGLGPTPVPVERVTPDVLADRIGRVLGEPLFRQRAGEFGARIGARNGVAAGVDHIERMDFRRRPEPLRAGR